MGLFGIEPKLVLLVLLVLLLDGAILPVRLLVPAMLDGARPLAVLVLPPTEIKLVSVANAACTAA